MEVDIDVETSAESLNQRHGTSFGIGFFEFCLFSVVRRDRGDRNVEGSCHEFGSDGKAESDGSWKSEDPLPNILVGQDGVDQMGCGLAHSPCPAAGAESAALTRKGDEHLVVALLALGAQKAVG